MEENLNVVIIFLGFIWLAWLSFLVFKTLNHYNRLTKGIAAGDLKNVLESLLKNQTVFDEETTSLKDRCADFEDKSRFFLREIRFARFNPFKDTGGDQSFVLAILDSFKNGIVISSLHSRTGTRWYAKTLKDGKGEEYELSDEEEKVLLEDNHNFLKT